MLRTDPELKSITDLIERIREDGHQGSVWYRGLSDSSYKLIPSLHRQSKRRNTSSIDEQNLVNRFKQNAHEFLDSRLQTEWEWMFLMRHHGAPSRLMDWTESPLVGLYFAVTLDNDNRANNKKDGVLWCLTPRVLNFTSRVTTSPTDPVPMFSDELGSTTASEDALQAYLVSSMTGRRREVRGPAAAIGLRLNKRMQAQRSVFTIHHAKIEPLEEYADRDHITRYIIPADCKENLRAELAMLMVTRLSIFPDLDSVAVEAGRA